MDSRRLLFLGAVLALGACASPVSLSILGGGASALVSHNLNSSVDRAFASPLPAVHQATIAALAYLRIAHQPLPTPAGETLRVSTDDRSMEIAFESLSSNLTLVRASVRRSGVTLDHATAAEIINQTERFLAGSSVPPTAARPVFVVRLTTVPAGQSVQLRPVPASLQDYWLFTTEAEGLEGRVVNVDIGYFLSEAEALAAQRIARAAFPGASVEKTGS